MGLITDIGKMSIILSFTSFHIFHYFFPEVAAEILNGYVSSFLCAHVFMFVSNQ